MENVWTEEKYVEVRKGREQKEEEERQEEGQMRVLLTHIE